MKKTMLEESNFISFFNYIKEKAREFDFKRVHIVSHLDSDGISSAALVIRFCELRDIKYKFTILPQLDRSFFGRKIDEDYNYIFCDIGSNNIEDISQTINKMSLVLDHHETIKKEFDNVIHINPHLFNIEGERIISGAGITYLFLKAADERIKEYAYLALIGAIGDNQEKNGFIGINQDILQDALNSKKVRIEKGLDIFGMQTRPLHKLLEYCSDKLIPGVTGNEGGAIDLLKKIGINPILKNGKWKKFYDLTGEEVSELTRAIIEKRKDLDNPKEILGIRYALIEQDHNSAYYDLKEFSTILNGCGRLKNPEVGIDACLDRNNGKYLARKALTEYKQEIRAFMRWFKENRRTDKIIEEKNYIIIDGRKDVPATMIGTMLSIITKSRILAGDKIILGIARQDDKLKLSLRSKGNQDLRKIMQDIVKDYAGEFGGHKNAAGAILKIDDEEELIKKSKNILSKITSK